MTERVEGVKRLSHAHAAGVVYLGYFSAAILGLALADHKLTAGAVINGLADVLYATVTILLYRLFRPAHPLLAAVAALCSLTGCAIDAVHQLHLGIAGVSPLLFFGPFCVLLGLLILQSKFLPRWLGWPLMAAGVGWLAYLVPPVALHGKIVIFPLGFLAEFALMVWLLLAGVDEAHWPEPRR